MNPSTAISYELAQARSTDLRRQARRESLARTALARPPKSEAQVPNRLRFVHRRRAIAALS